MSTYRKQYCASGSLVWLALAALLMQPFGAKATDEETFALLHIGTRTYTNVTVTTKAKNYIFIVHTGGMANIKIAELPTEVREELGYGGGRKVTGGTNGPVAWAKAGVAKLETEEVAQIKEKLRQSWRGNKSAGTPAIALMGMKLILAVVGVTLLAYLFHCYCFLLICQKAGHPPGPLVWFPVVQFIPLLRAAGMSAWWLLACLLPVLNLVTHILWSLNIAKARGKSGWVALFLILPITGFFAIVYLAFSGGTAAEEDKVEPQAMCLQTA